MVNDDHMNPLMKALITEAIKIKKATNEAHFNGFLGKLKNIRVVSLMLNTGIVSIHEVLRGTPLTRKDFILHGVESMAKKRNEVNEESSLATAC